MPRLNVSMLAGKPDAYRTAILDNLYRALRETLQVPEDDQFITLTEHTPTNFRFGNAYGVARSADLVYIQITVFDTRTPEQKKAHNDAAVFAIVETYAPPADVEMWPNLDGKDKNAVYRRALTVAKNADPNFEEPALYR